MSNDADCGRIEKFPGFDEVNMVKHNADKGFRGIKNFPGVSELKSCQYVKKARLVRLFPNYDIMTF